MSRFWKLFLHELSIHNKSYHITKNSFFILVCITIIYSLINPGSDQHTHKVLVLIGTVIIALSVPSYLIKHDLSDGSLENMMVSVDTSVILMIKYLVLCGALMTGLSLAMPFIALFCNFSIGEALRIYILGGLITIQSSSLVLLANIVHSYFRKNTNLILSLLIPLIMPSLILASLALPSTKWAFIYILLGIDLVMVPLMILFSNHLLKNIYNF